MDIKPKSTASCRSPLLLAAIALFVATRAWIVFAVEPPFSDTALYFQYAAMAVDRGRVPYQESFAIEYPPLAWWTMLAPRLLDPRRVDDAPRAADLWTLFPAYRGSFRALMLACDVVAFALLLAIARRAAPGLVPWAAIAYTVPTALSWNVLYDRLDAGLLLLLLLWAWCWQRSLGRDGRTLAWSAAAFAALGASISFKIIPVVCVPVLLLAEWRDARRRARLAVALPALAAGAGLPFLVQLAVSGPGVLALFGRHAGRGLQLESVYATAMLAVSRFGPEVEITHADGGFNLDGALAPPLKALATAALLALVLGASWWTLRCARDRRDGYRASCFVVAAAVIASNVVSPQYLVWALPVLLLLAIETLAARPRARWGLAALLALVAGLTTWIFPYNYFVGDIAPSSPHGIVPFPLDRALAPSPLGYLVLAARNALYLGTVIWLGMVSFLRPPQAIGAVVPAVGDDRRPRGRSTGAQGAEQPVEDRDRRAVVAVQARMVLGVHARRQI